MKLKKLLPILVLGIIPANATVIFIDNFVGSQTVFVTGPGSNQSGAAVGAGVLGGSRSLEVTQTAGGLTDIGTVGGGALTLSLSAADQGFALLTYDGDTNGTLTENGITPTDVTDGGQNIYIGLSVRSDLVAPITMTFYSGTGNSSSYTFNTPALGFAVPYTEYYIPMTSFLTLSGAGADFANITAATLLIDGTDPSAAGVDVQVKNYEATPAPEPASLGLMAAGLAGLFIRRRRKA